MIGDDDVVGGVGSDEGTDEGPGADALESDGAGQPDEDDRPSDWGVWLRNRLEQTAQREASPPEETGTAPPSTAGGEAPPPTSAPPNADEAPLPTPDEAPPRTPAPPTADDVGEDESEPAEYAEVAAPVATGDPRLAAEPAEPRAAVEARQPGVDSGVTRGLVALRAAVDDTIDRLDGLTAAFLAQGTDLGERLERHTAVTTTRLDQAVSTLTQQQREIRAAIDHILDRTADTSAAVSRLAATAEAAALAAGEEPWRQPLQVLAGELAAGRTAGAIQAAEMAEIGSRLDRIQEALDHLATTTDLRPPDAAPVGRPAVPLDPPLVELDEEQTETIARAVAALLADGTAPGPAPAPASRSAPSDDPARGLAPAGGHDSGPPGPRRRPARPQRRSEPLRAASSGAAKDSPGDAMSTPAWHPERS